jgi:hypothetical protein
MQYQCDKYIISFKENNLKLRFNAYYTIVLHFTFLPIRKLPATTADFCWLLASNDIPETELNMK